MLPDGADSYDMDVRDREAWGRSLDDFTRQTGQLDVLCNNAGIGVGGPLAEADFADLDALVAINFTGVLNGARIGHAYLARTPDSCLLNTASARSEEHTSELQSLMRTSYAVFCLNKKKK